MNDNDNKSNACQIETIILLLREIYSFNIYVYRSLHGVERDVRIEACLSKKISTACTHTHTHNTHANTHIYTLHIDIHRYSYKTYTKYSADNREFGNIQKMIHTS